MAKSRAARAVKTATKTAIKKSAAKKRSVINNKAAVKKRVTKKSAAKKKPIGAKRAAPKRVKATGTISTSRGRSPIRKQPVPESVIIKKPAIISKSQWELPAGFREDGSFAPLSEVISPRVHTLSLETLSTPDKKNLVIERIKLQPDYPTRYMLGVGEVNRERALAEVESNTPAGKTIQETEQKLIQMLQKAALKNL